MIEGIVEEGSLCVSFERVPQFKKTVILDFFILDYCEMFPQSVYHESDKKA